jgi:succinoglycan biosynthesis protein ExoA
LDEERKTVSAARVLVSTFFTRDPNFSNSAGLPELSFFAGAGLLLVLFFLEGIALHALIKNGNCSNAALSSSARSYWKFLSVERIKSCRKMRTSFIITARNRGQCNDAMRSLLALEASPEDFEVFFAMGSNPSAQRNRAAERAAGDCLLFLDGDSVVDPGLLRHYQNALRANPEISIIGGAAVYRSSGSFFSRVVSALFSSPFGTGPFRSRYIPQGEIRPATERDLILCNLLVKRSLFRRAGGFLTELYPSEENEFLNRLRKSANIFYHPLAVCHREPPRSLSEFLRKMLRYGSGRAKQLVLFPLYWDSFFLLPAFFSVGLITALVCFLWLGKAAFWIFILPAALYGLLTIYFSGKSAAQERWPILALLLPPLFFCCHFSYGLGLLWGFLRHPFFLRPKPIAAVEIVRAKGFHDQPLVEFGACLPAGQPCSFPAKVAVQVPLEC